MKIPRYVYYIAFFVLCVAWLAIPFFLDCKLLPLLEQGKNTNFNRESWFAFLGSYLPTTVFGLLTLYNSIQIKIQQDQIEMLQARKRFRFTGTPTLNCFDADKDTIGGLMIDELVSKLEDSEDLPDVDLSNGYLLNFNINDVEKRLGIERIDVEDIEWKMGPKNLAQKGIIYKNAWKTGPLNSFSVFWIYEENRKQRRQRVRCMNSKSLNSEGYRKSTVSMKFDVKLNDGDTCYMKAGIEFECTDNTTQLRAINYDCFVE